ncbi:hypothetical protein HBI56_078500 [Parastagonospora nodorum]|uniref:Uncharacterized protein n=1 Tax=Phaeosphaeria nodorum (strain SN15 / ATCC MYA-4574 / FGSC 10173) TaxID=321614 RepID=A0A7U2HZ95_PHANO|nr:hypothetical protein HBH56_148680 [Parastagonospora nodorum]QRC94126.1 hypothetical protein JI435_074060 [Parastagonospora nodorum SN15]KAH3923279.1 hypothetical protein HBH54_213320 [Parastagonospora nodorum]KAH3945924.1 hypothetical protein HBH53_136130 [Parastagonospora nodorum]KAH3983600.1 hypothetical protein HBH52_063880 [Parastagonospora nodorum]
MYRALPLDFEANDAVYSLGLGQCSYSLSPVVDNPQYVHRNTRGSGVSSTEMTYQATVLRPLTDNASSFCVPGIFASIQVPCHGESQTVVTGT